MKIIKYIVKIIIITILIQSLYIPVKVYADGPDASDFDGIFSEGADWIKKGKESKTQVIDTGGNVIGNMPMINDTQIQKNSNIIYKALFTIGVVLAVIIGGIIGIQFMIASVEEKAKIKEAMIPYILGCVVVFGSYGIWKFVLLVLNDL